MSADPRGRENRGETDLGVVSRKGIRRDGWRDQNKGQEKQRSGLGDAAGGENEGYPLMDGRGEWGVASLLVNYIYLQQYY